MAIMHNKHLLYHGMIASSASTVGFKPDQPDGGLRRNSEHLNKLDIPNDNHRTPFFKNILSGPTREETQEEGRALLGKFIFDEIDREEGLDTPDEIKVALDQLCTLQGTDKPSGAKVGQQLRRLADEFQRSQERSEVQRQADEFTENSDGVTQDQFRDLLSQLLGEGITKDRIVVLFFFCSDVAIKTLKRKAQSSVHLCQQFIQWSIDFITERVCSWVQANGGWGAIFNSTLPVVGRVALFFGVGIICYYGYKKFIKKLLPD